MANTHFRFKQFTIHQDNCAMKVCTDSCLFGGWVADWLQKESNDINSILDIGAGTGLLSLMLAQKLPSANIDAVEIETACCKQAEANVLQSDWNKNITVYNTDINRFTVVKTYDFIISNPPFYEQDLMGSGNGKNLAHHGVALTLRSLMSVVKKRLADNSYFGVLLPYHRMNEFEDIAQAEGFFVNKKALMKQTYKHCFFRVMFIFSREKREATNEEIIIKEHDDRYSSAFISLLEDYYLYL